MRLPLSTPSLALLVAAALAAVGCDGTNDDGDVPLPQGAERVDLDPAEFTVEIDNPYLPMTPGDRRVYLVTDPEGTKQRAVAVVTRRTRLIANGITARVVCTRVSERGELVEDNRAWYAQDGEGNVWYLGENAREIEGGRVKTRRGSWEAGVDGALPGVMMPARPEVGLAYREEHYSGVAEDRAEIFSLGERAEVRLGKYRDVLLIKETEGIERALLDYKFYARDVGPVLGIEVSAGSGREELVGFRDAPDGALPPPGSIHSTSSWSRGITPSMLLSGKSS
jgi:hypothetical protein